MLHFSNRNDIKFVFRKEAMEATRLVVSLSLSVHRLVRQWPGMRKFTLKPPYFSLYAWDSLRKGIHVHVHTVGMKSVIAILGCIDKNIPAERVFSSKTVIEHAASEFPVFGVGLENLGSANGHSTPE